MNRVPGQGRAATLALLHKMAGQNALGRGRGRGLTYDQYEDHPTSGMGRARDRNSIPCPSPEPLLCLPYTWAYVGAGRIYLLSQVLPVQSLRTQHLVLHPWSPSPDQNQGMRPGAQPHVQTRSLVFSVIFCIFCKLFGQKHYF